MSQTVTYEYEQKGRTRKALALADVFTVVHASAATVERLDEVGWEQAASLACVHPPSLVTRQLVVDLLAHRERLADPFDRLPRCEAPAPAFPVLSCACFAPIPQSGHQECDGVTERGLPCSCHCHTHPSRHGLRVVS